MDKSSLPDRWKIGTGISDSWAEVDYESFSDEFWPYEWTAYGFVAAPNPGCSHHRSHKFERYPCQSLEHQVWGHLVSYRQQHPDQRHRKPE